jgi:hypothetical protein
MEKIDLKKEMKSIYHASAKEVQMLEVQVMNYLMVDGTGDPNTSVEYQNAVEALYSVAYTLKFLVKKEQEIDYGVMPLEGLWWMDDMTEFRIDSKNKWKWTSLIMQPKYVTRDLVKMASEQVAGKKTLPALNKMRFESFKEGLAAQMLHIGPFSAEGPTIQKLHEYIKACGYVFDGVKQKHHEIYFNDPRRVNPEKMKTIIRQPMRKP